MSKMKLYVSIPHVLNGRPVFELLVNLLLESLGTYIKKLPFNFIMKYYQSKTIVRYLILLGKKIQKEN